MAAVRRILCVRLPQVRPLRGGSAGIAERPCDHRTARRAAARATKTRGGQARRSRATGVQRLPGRTCQGRQRNRSETEQDDRMTTPETPQAQPVTHYEKIRSPLLGYRGMAW